MVSRVRTLSIATIKRMIIYVDKFVREPPLTVAVKGLNRRDRTIRLEKNITDELPHLAEHRVVTSLDQDAKEDIRMLLLGVRIEFYELLIVLPNALGGISVCAGVLPRRNRLLHKHAQAVSERPTGIHDVRQRARGDNNSPNLVAGHNPAQLLHDTWGQACLRLLGLKTVDRCLRIPLSLEVGKDIRLPGVEIDDACKAHTPLARVGAQQWVVDPPCMSAKAD